MEKATDGVSTVGSSHVTAEFASNFWSELLGYPNMFTLSIKTKYINNMETGNMFGLTRKHLLLPIKLIYTQQINIQ